MVLVNDHRVRLSDDVLLRRRQLLFGVINRFLFLSLLIILKALRLLNTVFKLHVSSFKVILQFHLILIRRIVGLAVLHRLELLHLVEKLLGVAPDLA